jgi:hypothetical protein
MVRKRIMTMRAAGQGDDLQIGIIELDQAIEECEEIGPDAAGDGLTRLLADDADAHQRGATRR